MPQPNEILDERHAASDRLATETRIETKKWLEIAAIACPAILMAASKDSTCLEAKLIAQEAAKKILLLCHNTRPS